VKHIADSLTELFQTASFADGFTGWQAVHRWNEIVGDRIASRTKALRYENGRLFVEVCNSTWIQELSFLQRSITRRLNAAIGRNTIRSIHFVAAGRDK